MLWIFGLVVGYATSVCLSELTMKRYTAGLVPTSDDVTVRKNRNIVRALRELVM